NPGNIYVLFATDTQLKDFKSKLAKFQGGAKGNAKNAPYTHLFGAVERAIALEPKDRIGPRLKVRGISNAPGINGREVFVVDIEVWDAETRIERRVRVNRIEEHIRKNGGEIIGAPYIGDYGLILVRCRVKGTLLK